MLDGSPSCSFSWLQLPPGLSGIIDYQVKSIRMGFPPDPSTPGRSQTIQNLFLASFFALNIHGLNARRILYGSGSNYPYTSYNEGGSGLIIICKYLKFNGSINLKGADATSIFSSGSYACVSEGGGGSCIISYEHGSINNGSINTSSGSGGCGIPAGQGNKLFIIR